MWQTIPLQLGCLWVTGGSPQQLPTIHLPPVPNVSLMANEVDRGPGPNILGSLAGAFHGPDEAPEIRVQERGNALWVRLTVDGEVEQYAVELELTEDGAKCGVAVAYDMLTPVEVLDVSGVAFLLVAEETVTLEIEVYASELFGTQHISLLSFLGRVELAEPRARALAERWFESEAVAQASPFGARRRYQRPGVTADPAEGGSVEPIVSSGYVDNLGRRQGVWSVRGPFGRLDTTWVDGIPHGPATRWEAQRIRSLTPYELGLPRGVAYTWDAAGNLEGLHGFPSPRGTSVALELHPSGAKRSESLHQGPGAGAARGGAQRSVAWNEDGEVTHEFSTGYPFWEPPYARRPPRLRLPPEPFTEFHSRRLGRERLGE